MIIYVYEGVDAIEWFPATGFEHADAPELEVYLPGDTSAQDYKCEVWTPIVKNNK